MTPYKDMGMPSPEGKPATNELGDLWQSRAVDFTHPQSCLNDMLDGVIWLRTDDALPAYEAPCKVSVHFKGDGVRPYCYLKGKYCDHPNTEIDCALAWQIDAIGKMVRSYP